MSYFFKYIVPLYDFKFISVFLRRERKGEVISGNTKKPGNNETRNRKHKKKLINYTENTVLN